MARKILYAADSFYKLTQYHMPYLSRFCEKGMELHAAAFGDNQSCDCFTKIFYLPFSPSKNLYDNFMIIRSFIPIIKNEKYDLIVLDGTLVSKLIRTALMFIAGPRPYVINMVDIYPIEKKTGSLQKASFIFKEKLLRCVTDDIISFNPEDYKLAGKHKFYSKNLYNVPGLGIDLTKFAKPTHEQKLEARFTLDIPENAYVLLYIAEFTQWANHEMLIDAMRFMPENVYLFIPGNGPTLEMCREKADESGVLPKVHFMETIPSHIYCCQAADIAVDPALFESTAYTTVEALACGLPVVASDTKESRILIKNGENGYIFPSNNIFKFSQRIIDIYSDHELEERLSQADREHINKYNIDGILPQIERAMLF